MAQSIWTEGEARLLANMNRTLDDVNRAALDGLKKAGANIIKDAQRNLRTAGYNGGTVNATGRLSQSGKVQVLEDETLDVGFFSEASTGAKGYAAYVEYGRRAGAMPPVDNIAAWVKVKNSTRSGIKSALKSAAAFANKTPAQMIESTAWAIALTIARKGTKPHAFFNPAVKKNQAAVTRAITQAVNKITRKDSI